MKRDIERRFSWNLAHVKNLVSIYRTQLSSTGHGRRGHQQTDVLRAAVVLLHAALEDMLRSLAYWRLPHAPANVLDEIPLVGGTAMKVTLGALSTHRDKTVDEVIRTSTVASLERSNYNNPGEVCTTPIHWTNTEPLSGCMTQLEAAMTRRHRLVHRADENPNGGRGNHHVASIAPKTLDEWISNTENFVRDVFAQV